MVTIESKFIGDFKIGDNINCNLEILALLYDRFNGGDQQQRRLLCKPIVVLLASIVEAVLYDFHKRVNYSRSRECIILQPRRSSTYALQGSTTLRNT